MMAGTPAQNGNSAAGNSDFSRRAEELAQAMWLTPDVPNGGRALKPGTSATGKRPDGSKAQVGLNNQAVMWQTPRATTGEYTRDGGQKGAERLTLEGEATMWTTPQAHDVTMRGAGQKPTAKAGNACLARDATTWPTPAAQNVKGSSEGSITRADGKSRMDILHYRAEQGFSHPAPETSLHGLAPFQWRPTSRRLLRSVTSHVVRSSLARWLRAGNWRKRRLNPLFVEWLMGWPKGHALCDCSAMEFARWQQDMRGALSALPTASGPWIWKPPITAMQKETQLDLL